MTSSSPTTLLRLFSQREHYSQIVTAFSMAFFKIVNSELNDLQRTRLKHRLEDISGWWGSFIKEPGLSIGQMIEFLDEKTDWHLNITQFGLHNWIIEDMKSDKGEKALFHDTRFDGVELADALYKAVKDILNER